MKIEHKKIFCGPSEILKNISWSINIYQKLFMTSTKTLRLPLSYVLNVRSLGVKGMAAKISFCEYKT